VGVLFAQVSEQVSRLARQEIRLAEMEAKQRGKRAGIGFGALSFGGLLGFFGACCFVAAAILGMALVVQPWAAALAVGGMFVVVSGFFALPGLVAARSSGKGVGADAVANVKADLGALKGTSGR
jgi:membrane protein